MEPFWIGNDPEGVLYDPEGVLYDSEGVLYDPDGVLYDPEGVLQIPTTVTSWIVNFDVFYCLEILFSVGNKNKNVSYSNIHTTQWTNMLKLKLSYEYLILL